MQNLLPIIIEAATEYGIKTPACQMFLDKGPLANNYFGMEIKLVLGAARQKRRRAILSGGPPPTRTLPENEQVPNTPRIAEDVMLFVDAVMESLSDRQRDALLVMLVTGATSKQKRMKIEAVADAADGSISRESFGGEIAGLRKKGLTDAKEGNGGGV